MKEVLRHPLAIVATFSLLVVAGIVSTFSLPVELLPSLKYPRLVILTSFGNASSEEVESLLTRPVEEAVGTVTGLRSISSTSSEGTSSVVLRFNWGSNMSLAAAEVREKLDLIADEFPREAKLPIVVQYDPTDTPIVTLALAGGKDIAALYTLAKHTLKPELETISGVATVRISGGLAPEIQVLVDRGRLVAQTLDLKLITDRLESANINFPGGSLIKGPMELPVRTVGRFKSLGEIELVSLGKGVEGGTVRVKDVADVVASHADRTSLSRVNGQPAVLLGIIKEPSENTVEVSQRVINRLADLRRRVPQGTTLDVVDNEAPFIEKALDDLKTDILWGSLLAFGVLLIFLRNLRSTVFIMLAIPVSVVSTFALMSFSGVSLNIMSIGGMALGVGMLVDCSIVVLESIHRKRFQTQDIYEATSDALSEVGASVVSGTLTSLAVLVPILFMTGMAQKLFRDFALTMGGSLLISLFVSVLLLPAIMVWSQSSSKTSSSHDGEMSWIHAIYKRIVLFALEHPAKVIGTCVVLFIASALGIYRVGFELIPNINVGRFNINITLPPETSLNRLEKTVDEVEKNISKFPQVQSYVTEAGTDRNKTGLEPSQEIGKPNEARIAVRLDPESSVSKDTNLIMETLRREVESQEGARIDFTLNQGPLTRILGTKGNPELLRLSGDDFEQLGRSADELNKILAQKDWIKDISWDGNVWTEQYRVIVDRYKASAKGVSVDDVAHAVQTAIEGKTVGKFIEGDQEQDIRVRLKTKDKTTPDDLKDLALRSGQDDFIVLGGIATVTTGRGPREIIRTDRQRNVILHGNITGVAISKGEEDVLTAARGIALPSGYTAKPGISRFELMESMEGLFYAVLLASILVYTILVIQFESLVWPLVVFTAVPISIVGPAIALNLGGSPVNVLVLIGAVVLVGIVVNMAILMVTTINDLRRHGVALRSAVIEGCATRLRPILMTTATTVFGALPICLAQGAADQLNKPLAITVVAGLLASAAFKLIGLPVVYELVAKTRFGAVSHVQPVRDT